MIDIPSVIPSHRNFRPGLIIFGSLSTLLGLLCLLMIPLMIYGSSIHVEGQPQTTLPMLLPALAFYLLVAVIDFSLGIGSMFCRRWARALMLLWSLFWLFCGICGLTFFCLMHDNMTASFAQSATSVPPNISTAIQIFVVVFLGLIYIVLPGAFVWFYSLRNTRLTCEARDTKIRWTDRCPLPVLGLSLLNAMKAVCFPLMLLYAPIFPFFGIFLQGSAAYALILTLSLIFAVNAWGLYKLKPLAWWQTLACIILLCTSYVVTFRDGAIMKMYHLMHLPESTLQLLEKNPFLQSNYLPLLGLLYLLPYIGVMCYVKKDFRNTAGPSS